MTERSTPSCSRSRAIVCLNTWTVPPHQNRCRTSQTRPQIEAGRDWPDKSPSVYQNQVKWGVSQPDTDTPFESEEVTKKTGFGLPGPYLLRNKAVHAVGNERDHGARRRSEVLRLFCFS
jgi:hypothetical protein